MTQSALRIASDHDAKPGSALHAMARELAAAQEMALDLEMTVAELVARAGTTPGDVLFRLQEFDRLAQTLGDLSRFAAAMATAAPDGWRLDGWAAARGLHLRDLAVRLATGEAMLVRASGASEAEDDFLL